MITFTLCFFFNIYWFVHIKFAKSTVDIACNREKKTSCSRVIDKRARKKKRMNIDHALHQIRIVVAYTSMNKKKERDDSPKRFS